jgi:hypothetical protein
MTAPRAALVIGHPGHELHVHGWLGRARPAACVLTDGTGLGRPPRLEPTRAILAERGCTPGPVFGRWSDRDVYAALLDRKTRDFVAVARELADWLVELRAEAAVADTAEGFSPTHDLCRLIADAAAARAARRLGRPIARFEYAQFLPTPAPGDAPAGSRWLELDSAEFAAKRRTAFAYAELHEEVQDAVRRFGVASFARECLRRCAGEPGSYTAPASPTLYELGGEDLLRRGQVARVIRRAHLETVAAALARDLAGD